MTDILKRAISDDVFTTREEAVSRAMQIGLGQTSHTHEGENGQAVYMPGETHEAYLQFMGKQDIMGAPENQSELAEAVAAIIGAILNRNAMEYKTSEDLPIMKMDEEQRIVYGWASVVTEKGNPVIDRQGDVIEPETMEKAATEFMQSVRTAKAMHDGEGIGEVIHSLPITKDIMSSLGIESEREGWIIAMKINDDEVWKRVKSGELRSFSIGGKAMKEEYNANKS